jgi:putative FmdB family regulatory protein
MPLYEYECDACGHRFEVIQKFSDPPVAKCPVCGGTVHKMQSAPAIQFKGTGWYITDYPKSGQSRSDGHDGGKKAEASKDAKTSSSTDSTPATGTAPAAAPSSPKKD